MEGKFTGVNSGTDGTWIGQAIGSYTGTDLKFVSEIGADVSDMNLEGQIVTGRMNALVGGTDSLWRGSNVPVTILGEHVKAYLYSGDPYGIWHSEIASFNYSTFTTYDGGAYRGFIGGIDYPSTLSGQNTLEGGLIALYVDPSGNAGYLKGSLTGKAYLDIDMVDMAGTLNREQKVSNIGIAPENLYTSIYGYVGYGSGTLAGSIGTEGWIRGVNADFNLCTMFIVDMDTKTPQPWGIYRADDYGEFSNLSPATTWSAKVGGWAPFGVYYDAGGSPHNDGGYFLADINNGSIDTSMGKLTGTLDGRFITYTKLGTMAGDVLGTMRAADNTWNAVSLGTWGGTPLKFVSDVHASILHTVRAYTGQYNYSGTEGGYYSYQYISDNSYGHSENHPKSSDYPHIHTYYYGDGTTHTEGYDENGNSISSSGTWDTTQSLAFLATQPQGTTFYYTSDYLTTTDTGYMNILMGGTDSLWTEGNKPITIMGELRSFPHSGDQHGIWYSEIKSHNIKNNTDTTLDGEGSYVGYISGYEKAGKIEGGIRTLYLKNKDNSNSEAGILSGSFTGQAYKNIEMWEGHGTIASVYLGDKTIPYTSLLSSVLKTDLYPDSYNAASLVVNGASMGGTNPFRYGIHYMTLDGGLAGSWGVWNTAIGGQGVDLSSSWTASFEYADSSRTIGYDITGNTSYNICTGSVVGYGADLNLTTPATWVSVGNVQGTFDPIHIPATFQIGAMGVSIETKTYLNLATTDAGREKLQQLGIPAVQVGSVNLTYNSESDYLRNVYINNMKFFAYSAADRPKLWASGDVGGSYTGTPTGFVTLSGGGLSAQFNVKTWDAINGKWLSTVTNGTGSITGGGANVQNLNFRGAAAGTINTGNATFSGTAAGIAK